MPIPFMLDKIDITTTGGIDLFGQPQTIIVASGVPARVQRVNTIVLKEDGQEVVSDFTAFLSPDVSIKTNDRIILNGDTFEVLKVIPQQNNVQVDHLEVRGRIRNIL